jgi:hypothetical protein
MTKIILLMTAGVALAGAALFANFNSVFCYDEGPGLPIVRTTTTLITSGPDAGNYMELVQSYSGASYSSGGSRVVTPGHAYSNYYYMIEFPHLQVDCP